MFVFLSLIVINLFAITEYDQKAYGDAVVFADVDKIKLFIDRFGVNAVLNVNGNTPLHLAAQNNDATIVKFLIEHGAQINAKNTSGRTPLQEAEQYKFYTMEHYLNGSNPLHWAMYDNEPLSIVQELITKNKDWLNALDSNGNTPLHIAVSHADIPVIKLLVSSGANLQAKNKFNRTPLAEADTKGRYELSMYLKSNNPLQQMILEGKKSQDIENSIDTYKDLINIPDADGNTALHLAAQYDLLNVSKALIMHGADISSRNRKGNTPFDEAQANSLYSLAKYLNGSTPLHWAIYDGKSLTEIEKLIAQDKTLINKADKEGNTPLHIAAIYDDRGELIQLLIKSGAFLETKNKAGKTPFDLPPLDSVTRRYLLYIHDDLVKKFNNDLMVLRFLTLE